MTLATMVSEGKSGKEYFGSITKGFGMKTNKYGFD